MTASASARHGLGPHGDAVARRARVAVSVLFAVNGLILANLVPWLPSIKADLSLTNTAFGVGWAAGPLGGLTLGMAAGPLAARFGSGRTATVWALLGAAVLPLIAVASSWLAFAGAMFALGATDAVTDAAMNSHGLRVQRRYGRSIINSFHALWSAGAVVGGLVGAAAVGLGVARPVHLTVVAVVLAIVLIVISRWQLPGPEDAERGPHPAADAGPLRPDGGAGPLRPDGGAAVERGTSSGGARGGQDGAGGDAEAVPRGRIGLVHAMRTAPWLLLGFAALPTLGGAVEDSAASWSAVYLRATLGALPFVAGLGFVATQTMMVVGRLTGDRFVDRFGAATVARSGSLLAALGMTAVVVGSAPAVVIAGFGLSGLGVATLFPLGLAAAGNIPGVRSADGVAIAAWIARLSFLVVPPAVGVVADAAGLRWGLVLVLICALGAAALAGLLRYDR